MMILNKSEILSSFQTIPSVGKACALDFWNIGLRSIEDLKGKNPAELYHQLNKISGVKHDICMLYTFRCAVYFATEKKHDPEKLKWWYWKDKSYNESCIRNFFLGKAIFRGTVPYIILRYIDKVPENILLFLVTFCKPMTPMEAASHTLNAVFMVTICKPEIPVF